MKKKKKPALLKRTKVISRARRTAKKTKRPTQRRAGRLLAKKPADAFEKFERNPIVAPRAENEWEEWQTFNPGAVLLGGKIHLLYRAIGRDGLSRLGYASSIDGFTVDKRLRHPVYEHKTGNCSYNVYSLLSGGSWGGAEDPRLTRVDDEDTLYMTYTAASGGLGVALTSIKINDFLNKRWKWKRPVLISPPWQVHKNWVIFPEKINGKYAILHSINPEILVTYVDSLDFDESAGYCIESFYGSEFKKRRSWDGWVRGVGPPPLKTDYGWLVFYHAMENDDWSKYKVGAMILDHNNPTKILYRSRGPVLEPSETYELSGFKGGVVYASGAVVKNGTLFLYYGGADSYVCVATANLESFLTDLAAGRESKLAAKRMKTRKG